MRLEEVAGRTVRIRRVRVMRIRTRAVMMGLMYDVFSDIFAFLSQGRCDAGVARVADLEQVVNLYRELGVLSGGVEMVCR